VEIKVEKVVIHPKWNSRVIDNDIALFKLAKPVTFTDYIQPACLPSVPAPLGSKDCYITGWGKIRHPGSMHSYLQQAVMPPVDSKTCYAKNKGTINIPITAGMQCAGEGGVNTISGCHGDSGGPYVCKIGGNWEVQGAVSHGSPRCSSTETYTVFANVYYFKQWILKEMQK
jgi:secreted trypsin-like serine protease